MKVADMERVCLEATATALVARLAATTVANGRVIARPKAQAANDVFKAFASDTEGVFLPTVRAAIFRVSPADVASAVTERQRKRDERARFLRYLRATQRDMLARIRKDLGIADE